MVTPKSQPYTYTLELLKFAVLRLPPTFSKEKRRAYEKKLAQFEEKPSAKYADIQKTIIALGKDSWAYRKAYEDMYKRYGRSSEEAFLLENLPPDVREKYETFIHEGGKLHYVSAIRNEKEMLQPSPFERYFSPREKFEIEQSYLIARDYARAEIEKLVADLKRDEYRKLVKAYAARQDRMVKKLDELRRLATVSKKWEPAIRDRIRTIEEGFSAIERDIDAEDLDRETEHWKGMLQSFLKA